MDMTHKIIALFGDMAKEIVQDNPYILMEKIDRFGFKKNDAFALKIGIPENSVIRLKALLTFVLNEALYSVGNSFISKGELYDYTTRYLEKDIDSDTFEEVLVNLVEEKKIYIDEEKNIFDYKMYVQELELAFTLSSMLKGTNETKPLEYKEEDIPKIVKETGLPVVVKPIDSGSSIGVYIAKTREELQEAYLVITNTDASQLKTIYEDEYLLVVNKPSGMLSVPGKTDQVSVASLMTERYPEATGPLVVHRLDMDTSGLLLIAKTKEVHACLQEQFEKQEIRKRYIALLSGKPDVASTGFIRLPLCPDYENRPLQKVDYEHGKPAITRYELLEDTAHTRIAFYPQTGRTHQLRVHAAHPEGLNTPIIGDPLYGQPAERLYLHAERLEFRHPATHKIIRIEKAAPF